MRYKRITALLLSLVMTALMCSCGSADSKRYIAVIVKSVNSDFFVNMQKGVESAATEYNVTVTFEGPENEEDYVTQNLMIEAAVKNGRLPGWGIVVDEMSGKGKLPDLRAGERT